MTPTETSSSVVERIKELHLKPKAPWVVKFRRSIFWMLFTVSVLIGSKAIALTMHVLDQEDLPLLLQQRPDLNVLVDALPLLWVTTFLIFIVGATWFLQHTPKGYKWTLPAILAMNLGTSVFLACIFYGTGLTPLFEQHVIKHVGPSYMAEEFRVELWNKPQEGMLRGFITKVQTGSTFILRDPTGRTWIVEFGSGSLKRDLTITSGTMVRVKGNSTEQETFYAEQIVPDKPPRMLRWGRR